MLFGQSMATLPPSLAISPCCLTCGASRSSKSSPAYHYIYRNQIRYGIENTYLETKLICGEVAENVARTSCRHLNSKVSATSRVFIEEMEQRVTTIPEAEDMLKSLTYLFWTEIGGQVKVSVRKKNVKHAVYIEVSSLQLHGSDDRLFLSWGIYRDDSSCFMHLDAQSSMLDGRATTRETPFIQNTEGRFVLELEFEPKQIPFYLSFLLKSSLGSDPSGSEIRSHRKTNFCVPVGFGSGYPAPLGLTFSPDGSMNFAIFSRNAESVVLCLYDDMTTDEPTLELDLDPYTNRSGDVWHASLESAWTFVSYGYRCKGPLTQRNKDNADAGEILLDPYAKIIGNSIPSNRGSGYLGRLCKEPAFDWGDDVHPNLPMEKLAVYRLNVRHFTEHRSSQLPKDVAGTFSGLTEKLQHFKDLSMNAVLLEPIFSFHEQNGPYFPCHFFSPTNQYGPSGGSISAINSTKEMVKKLHANGIEVLLEVAFTHTAVGGALQGIDDLSYYYANGVGDSKATNSLNCNYPIVLQLILDGLRYWVTEFHVDGFCFINASSLMKGFHGEQLSRPPLVEAIAFDPFLSKVKIIADCWDPHDMLPKETRFPHWKKWAEINTKFCNDVRNFWRGEGLLSSLATRLCGSGDTFSDGRGPAFSFNFTARSFGLTLVDLVSFSNTDALASHLSWNCGEEGPTDNTTILEMRLKQIRNFLFVLYISLGVPILNMGDECGQSSGGSPAYADRQPFDWNALRTGFGIQTTQFISFLNSLRMRRSDLLQKGSFLKEENIDWHGNDQSPPRWEDPSCKFLSVTLKADKVECPLNSESSHLRGDLFIAFNAADHSEGVILPKPPEGMSWWRLVDTALPFPGYFSINGEPVPEQMEGLAAYEMKSHSSALFEACSPSTQTTPSLNM
ncbi:isoamylase 2, chloroplastic [Carya illinoinensis]|uniref:Glycosyl hydrolase family 13 catalytic domain-containing protein n=1 Tax=Carya illinoinensis TaxID=32201 RepID=A0A8T1PUT2_CARIL|nr:isoamylase 2, chloroplastic [Carya illinoinensis]XP_042992354.1 isoamylase 2, chloroplastic [Carya illinoinensis]KAG6645160.1 hypothetical protein CIPAW_08G103200 [Carya illinoinensis]KAG6645161.1 hypothetical protein CIPAW_08G103200 [Carya illinoinensis]